MRLPPEMFHFVETGCSWRFFSPLLSGCVWLLFGRFPGRSWGSWGPRIWTLTSYPATVVGAFSACPLLSPSASLACAVAAGCNVFLNIVLLEWLGFIGSPIATACSRWIAVVVLFFCARREFSVCRVFTFPTGFTVTRMHQFMSLNLPMTLQEIVEKLFLQITALFAARLQPQALATHNAMLTGFMFLCSAMIGCQAATQTRLAHHLYQGDREGIAVLLRFSFRFMLGWSFIVLAFYATLQDHVGMIFSVNPIVWDLSGQLSLLCGSCYAVIAVFMWSGAVLNVVGCSSWFAGSYVVGTAFVGLPVAWYCGFRLSSADLVGWPYFHPDEGPGAGLLGIWLGLLAGYSCTAALTFWRVARISDWGDRCKSARRLAGARVDLLGADGTQ
mmetsp:Transcript_117018/g.268607  ORF Transcript_117018/g.268607 Transcript_117018/m.268607 type:complete len:387 (-) Transcript_117018:171-1331(-)